MTSHFSQAELTGLNFRRQKRRTPITNAVLMDRIDEKGMNSQIVQMSIQSGIPVPKKANAFLVN